MIKIGERAPDFVGRSEDGREVKLSDYKGKKLILYFYPKDSTSGCTAEACSLRDGFEELRTMGFEVVGVSPDSADSHRKFIAKESLPFKLIADTDHAVAEAYGAWGQKKFMGREYMGIIRQTFVINERGVVEKIFDKVDTKNHFTQIVDSYK